ncbi:MAG TPA: arginine--tRNA ligase [Solirubrobacterales bacterium]|nr:arginine--tRNA ligase [Solirubrobacterales bacterium]
MADPLQELRTAIHSAADALRDGSSGSVAPTLERPPKPELGDYSTNAAMLLAPARGEAPRRIAELLRDELGDLLGESADRIEVAGPGFVNVFLADRWHRESLAALLAAGEGFGRGAPKAPERVLVEFVSANPTGPLTVASGRGAAYGDALARLLELAGHQVEREYLLNDVGGQVTLFAESIAARMRGHEAPEGGYSGEYVAELADDLAGRGLDADDLDRLARAGTEAMGKGIERTLERFGVTFDTWFSERSLHEAGEIEGAISELREQGHVYERDGAVWLRTTAFGDDKDRVLLRSDGEPTYFAADIAYHRDKLRRGAARLIDPLGADHHGYVPRMRAALEAMGYDPDRFEAPMMQLVRLLEGDARARMSKRRGEFVTLDELIDDIGVDAARFFMVQRSHDTALDLDLELARSQSQDNPVYYVQYAHARIASILRKAVAEGGAANAGDGRADEAALAAGAGAEAALDAPAAPAERALVKRLLELPAEAAAAAERRAPHRLAAYATATAADFHAFYRDCQVVGAGGGLEQARLAICVAAKRGIATTLELLGVSAPERM